MSMKQYEFWFVVGSQFLYGPEVLQTVARRAADHRALDLIEVAPAPLFVLFDHIVLLFDLVSVKIIAAEIPVKFFEIILRWRS